MITSTATCKCGALKADYSMMLGPDKGDMSGIPTKGMAIPVWRVLIGEFYISYTSIICIQCGSPCWSKFPS